MVGCEWVAARLPGGPPVCILIVEDEPITLLATATWLEDAGFKVMTAHDGLHAVELL